MSIDHLTSPTALAVIALLALAFVRFGVWWAIIRVLLSAMLRPLSLLVIGVALAAVAAAYGTG